MAKTLSFTDTSPRTVKIGDTTTSFTLICGNDNVATDLTNATSITVKLGNDSGYLKSATIDPASLTDPTTGQVTVKFNADLMTSLPAGNYALEVWVVDSTGTSIYPSDGSTGFTITNNIQSANGSTITKITFDEFVAAMNKAASTIAKGDKGSGVWSMKAAAGGNLAGRWVTDLYNASSTNIPSVNDLVIQPDGNVFSVINVAKDTTAGGGYTFDIGPVLYNIKGDKGDTGTVDNAGLTNAPAFVNLQTQVDNSAVGTNLLTGTSDFTGWTCSEKAPGTTDGLTYAHLYANAPVVAPNLTLSESTTYTVSFDALGYAAGTTPISIGYSKDSNGNIIASDYVNVTLNALDGASVRVSLTFTTSPSFTKADFNIGCGKDFPATSGSIYIRHVKLELGSHATDWSLNPSEILTQSDYSKIKAAIVALGGSLS